MSSADRQQDLRRFHRIFHSVQGILSLNENKTWPCQVRDISLHGCLLHFTGTAPEDWEADYRLDIPLTEEVHVRMVLAVAHAHGDEVGFVCQHIDLDSITHLRRLVELNLGDSQLLERDILALTMVD